MKKACTRRLIARGVNLIEIGITNDLYYVDLQIAIEWLYHIWNNINEEATRHFWAKTKILD